MMLTHLQARSPNPILDVQFSTQGPLRRSYAFLKAKKTMQEGGQFPCNPKKRKQIKNHAARLTCLLQVLHLLQMAQHPIANLPTRHKSGLSRVHHMLKSRPKAGSQSLGQQLVVVIEEGNGAVAVQQGLGALSLVQQGDDLLADGGWQAEAMLSLKGILQDCQQLFAQHLPELGEELIRQAV